MMRNTVLPLLWTLALAVMLGVALWFSIPANASPADICDSLDRHPTAAGLLDVLHFEAAADQLPPDAAADVVVAAIYSTCPRHITLLDRFVALHRKAT